MQLKLFSEYPELRPKPNSNMEYGQTYQHKVALWVEGLIGEEMRGTYIQDDICINFSNDIVCNDRIIEVKSISEDRPTEEWYFNSSILQCAIYKSLIEKSDGKLKTATFFTELGNPSIETVVKNDIDYILLFGTTPYKINVTDSDKIVDFIIEKAKSTLTWEDAKIFDTHFKHMEYETLKSCLNYTRFDINRSNYTQIIPEQI